MRLEWALITKEEDWSQVIEVTTVFKIHFTISLSSSGIGYFTAQFMVLFIKTKSHSSN